MAFFGNKIRDVGTSDGGIMAAFQYEVNDIFELPDTCNLRRCDPRSDVFSVDTHP